MSNPPINYAKRLYGSFPNLFFIGVIAFLAFAINPGFWFLLIAGELSILLIAQNPYVQRLLRARGAEESQQDDEKLIEQILASLPESYRVDYRALDQLCREIEQRAGEVKRGNVAGGLADGIIEKLATFRSEYAQMLRAHFQLANRNYKDLQHRLAEEIRRMEHSLIEEQSPQVRTTLEQNLQILRQRSAKLVQIADLVRLIEARLQVVRNSLQLIQDEVYSMTDVRGISTVVDNLLINLELNDEYRNYYQDFMNNQGSTLANLDNVTGQLSLEPEFDNRPKPPNRVKQ